MGLPADTRVEETGFRRPASGFRLSASGFRLSLLVGTFAAPVSAKEQKGSVFAITDSLQTVVYLLEALTHAGFSLLLESTTLPL